MTSKDTKEEKIKTITLNTWEDFEQAIKEDNDQFQNFKNDLGKQGIKTHFSKLLFRGEAIDQNLETSLERFCKERKLPNEYSWEAYHKILERVYPVIKSQTPHPLKLKKFEYPEPPDNPKTPPSYELMVYMRHHGFPSPLLDWTRSPYVAAFFAFNRPKKCERVAIFSFKEFAGQAKSPNPPYYIWTAGPYIKTHERHYHQQCEYTHCYKRENDQKERIYCSHLELDYGNNQDILKKYTLPASERDKVMEKLDQMNINSFTLFGNEEGLMDMLAYREIENFLK